MRTEDLCKCGQPHDGWTGEDGSQLCQMCWESECDKSWWAMVKILEELERLERR